MSDGTDRFDTVDIQGARYFSVVFGINTRGDTAGGYSDQHGRLHGFLRLHNNITRIDFPGAGATFVTRLNDSGQAVGAYGSDPYTAVFDLPHGFLLDHGVFRKIDVPGAVETRPFGINNAGQIVGEYLDNTGRSHGFLLSNGIYTTVDVQDGTSTRALDINDEGVIACLAFNISFIGSNGGTIRGFLRDSQGNLTPIDPPAAPQLPGQPELPATQSLALNNLGQVTGVVSDSDGYHSFLWDNGVFTIFKVPAAVSSTFAFDINDGGQIAGGYDLIVHGVLKDSYGNFITIDHPDGVEETILTSSNTQCQIVGQYIDAEHAIHSFLLDKGIFTTLNIPSALGSGAIKINNRGQIIGIYSTLTSRTPAYPGHGYLWENGVVTLIDFPGAQHTGLGDINNRGQIIGVYAGDDQVPHSFIREPDGTLKNIDIPNLPGAVVTNINDSGQMLGTYFEDSGTTHGFLFQNGVVTIIDFPGATAGTTPTAINNDGTIVGLYFDDTRAYGFVLSHGRFSRFRAPGSFMLTYPYGIDDYGRISGIYN